MTTGSEHALMNQEGMQKVMTPVSFIPSMSGYPPISPSDIVEPRTSIKGRDSISETLRPRWDLPMPVGPRIRIAISDGRLGATLKKVLMFIFVIL
jgi:hypothetical protein